MSASAMGFESLIEAAFRAFFNGGQVGYTATGGTVLVFLALMEESCTAAVFAGAGVGVGVGVRGFAVAVGFGDFDCVAAVGVTVWAGAVMTRTF